MAIVPQAGAEYVQRVLSDGTLTIYVRTGTLQVADDAGRGACLVRAGQLTVVPPGRAPAEPLTYDWVSAQPYFGDDAPESEPPFLGLALSPKCLCCGHRNPSGTAACVQCGSPIT